MTKYIYSIKNLIDVFKALEFNDVEFDYIEFNDWYFKAKTEDGNVGIIFNSHFQEADYFYSKHPHAKFHLCSLVRLGSIRKEIHNILIQPTNDEDYLINIGIEELASTSILADTLNPSNDTEFIETTPTEPHNASGDLYFNLELIEQEVFNEKNQIASYFIKDNDIYFNLDSLEQLSN